jgi:Family of unknown function (DUF5906)
MNVQQLTTENKPHAVIKGFQLWWQKGPAPAELVSVIPPNPPGGISPNSSVKEGGKVPGYRTKSGWVGNPDYTKSTYEFTEKMARYAHQRGATVGQLAKHLPCVDIDIENPMHARGIQDLAFQVFGPTCVRGREGSNKCLLMYRLADGEAPFPKSRIEISDEKGFIGAVEILGKDRYYNVDGIHPSGKPYVWDRHPCAEGNALPRITKAQAFKFNAELHDYCDMMGLTVGRVQGSTESKPRQKLDNASLHAPSPEHVIELLKVWRPEHFTHDEYVRALAAIKASLGPRRDEFKGEVLEWSPGVRASEGDAFEKRWDSIKDSTLGWSWLCGQAHRFGYMGDVEADFAVDAPPEHMPGGSGGQLNPVEAMLARYVWCEALDRYIDIKTNTPISAKSFNTKNVRVSEFGNSGIKSSEAQFQNNSSARKVEIATYRPGQPVLIEDTNPGGVIVPAVNLWRPSLLVPARYVSDEDVSPWLQHVKLLFGDVDGPAAGHFLDFCAFLLQRPGVKINHAMVLLSETQGIGKDTVLDPIFKVIGDRNVQNVSPERLRGQWTDYLQAQVIYVPEIMNFSKREMATKLKDFITTPPNFVSVNTKNVKQYDIPKVQNWIMSTNNDDALSIELTDRRYWICQMLLETPMPKAHYKALWHWLEKEDGRAKVAGWLLKRDLSAFDPMATPPNTEAKRRMLEYSQPAQVRWLLKEFTEGGAFATRTLVIAEDLLSRACQRANEDFTAPTNINYKHIAAALKAEGFKKGPRIKIDGDARQLWVRDPDGILPRLSIDQVRDKYLLEAARAEAARGGVRDRVGRGGSVIDELSRKMAS